MIVISSVPLISPEELQFTIPAHGPCNPLLLTASEISRCSVLGRRKKRRQTLVGWGLVVEPVPCIDKHEHFAPSSMPMLESFKDLSLGSQA